MTSELNNVWYPFTPVFLAVLGLILVSVSQNKASDNLCLLYSTVSAVAQIIISSSSYCPPHQSKHVNNLPLLLLQELKAKLFPSSSVIPFLTPLVLPSRKRQ